MLPCATLTTHCPSLGRTWDGWKQWKVGQWGSVCSLPDVWLACVASPPSQRFDFQIFQASRSSCYHSPNSHAVSGIKAWVETQLHEKGLDAAHHGVPGEWGTGYLEERTSGSWAAGAVTLEGNVVSYTERRDAGFGTNSFSLISKWLLRVDQKCLSVMDSGARYTNLYK